MNKSNGNMYEFVTETWNPVTGCQHGCEYCYAVGIARRFEGKGDLRESESGLYMGKTNFGRLAENGIYEIKYPLTRGDCPNLCKPYKGRRTPYPFGFAPTFHRYRLDELQHIKKPQNIFVCSMADLFGEWVPDEWIKTVLEVCKKSPRHKYLFQSKNPRRFTEYDQYMPENYITGTTIETNRIYPCMGNTPPPEDRAIAMDGRYGFITIEPILDFDLDLFVSMLKNANPEYINIGADSGNNHLPEPEPDKIRELIKELEVFTKVNLKKNLKRLLPEVIDE